MSGKDDGAPGKGEGKPTKAAKPAPPAKQPPIDVVDDTPFPVPELYFKIFDSELDEPEAKVRRDVNKLYDKWLKEHGRRWPEKGLNTEDLVWLQEEAYKPQPGLYQAGAVPRDPQQLKQLGIKPVEEAAYDGEFLTDDWDTKAPGKGAAGASGGAAQAARRKVSTHGTAACRSGSLSIGTHWVLRLRTVTQQPC